MRGRHPDIDRRQLAVWVERFFACGAATSGSGSATRRRFTSTLSGGFEREIAELHDYVAAGDG